MLLLIFGDAWWSLVVRASKSLAWELLPQKDMLVTKTQAWQGRYCPVAVTPQITRKLMDAGGSMLGIAIPAPCSAAMVVDAPAGQDVAPVTPVQVMLVHDKPAATGSFMTAPITVLGPRLDTVSV